MLQARFEQAPDEDPRMAAIGRAHRLNIEQVAQQRHPFGIVEHQCRGVGRGFQFGHQPGSHSSVRPRPGAAPGKPGHSLAQGGSERRQAERCAQLLDRFKRGTNRGPGGCTGGPGEMGIKPGQCPGRTRPAQPAIERSRRRQPILSLAALPADQRMLDQCQHGDRRHTFRRHTGDGQQQGPGRCLAKRLTGAVVGFDPPPPEQGRHTRGKHPVGGDQGRGLPGRFERLAKRDRDPHRLACRIGEFGGANPRQAALAGRQAAPFVAEIGGGHGIGDGSATDGRRCGSPAAAPDIDLSARDVDPVEQQFQMILRVAFFAFPGFAAPVIVGAERVPFLVAHDVRKRQSRQHHCAARHARNAAQQSRNRGRRGGDPGDDGETRRRRCRPALRRRAEQPVAPFGQIDCAAPREFVGPSLDDRLQPVERKLPVTRQIVRLEGHLPQFQRRHFLDRQRVERPREIGGEAHCFGRALPAAPDNPRKRQLPRQRVDRARDRGVTVRRIERAADPVVKIGITDRDQSR